MRAVPAPDFPRAYIKAREAALDSWKDIKDQNQDISIRFIITSNQGIGALRSHEQQCLYS